MRVLLLAAALCALPALAADPLKTRSILVLEMKGDPSVVDAATLSTITSTLSVSVSHHKGLSVLTTQDVKNLVDIEAQKQLLGCTPGSESCLAEVASAMGAELVLSGDVGKLGSSYIINLHLFDAAKAKSVGRDSITVPDLGQLPQLLDASTAALLSPITGQQALVSRPTGVAVPTIDANALRSGGLKTINLEAEKALELALDRQDDASASPESKRDAWCALANVQGSNPYLGAAQKACSEWTQYVSANDALKLSVANDYKTLAGFLQLKRKTKEQKLEAIDAFLDAYARLPGRPEVDAVKDARERIARGADTVELPDLVDHDNDGMIVDDRCPNEAEDKDGQEDDDGCFDKDPEPPPDPSEWMGECLDTIGCLAFDFDGTPHLGLVIGTHLSLMDHVTKPETLDPELPPSLVLGMRFAWAMVEGGVNIDFDFLNGSLKSGFIDDDGDGIDDVTGSDVEFDPGVFFHGYGGLQAVAIGFEELTLLRPSVGVDVYADAFEDYDVGVYVANTFAVAGMLQLRVFGRQQVLGDNVVRPVQAGVELSIDYGALLE